MTSLCQASKRLAEMLSIKEGTDELLDFGDTSWASYWSMFEHARPADETQHPQLLHRVTTIDYLYLHLHLLHSRQSQF